LVPSQSLDLILYRFLLALAVVCSSIAQAQATPTVRPDDPVYGLIDRLVAARLVDAVIVGQRPLSRLEIGRIIAEAQRRGPAGWMRATLEEYAAIYPDSLLEAQSTQGAKAEVTVIESPPRGIAADGNGSIDVALNPLVGNRLGRAQVNGVTAVVTLEGGFGLGRHLAIDFDIGSHFLDERGRDAARDRSGEKLALRGLWKNVAIGVGRDYFVIGQGETAGLTNSLNSPALDGIRIASDRAFRLPWLLRAAGPMHATAVLADLGREQHFPHTRLFAYKVSMRPHPLFEIGTSFAEQVGGQGAPGGTFLQKAGDAFPLLDALFLHRNFLFSNKLIGVDIRYTLPYVRGMQFYAEGAFDDFDTRRIRSTFTEDAAYVWGLSASCFRECGPVRMSTEYHVTGLRFYTHTGFQNGYTLRDQFIGDQLGPRGRAGYGAAEVDRGSHGVKLELAYEARSGNKYGSVATAPNDADFRFVILEHHPTERRWRAATTLRAGSTTIGHSARLTVGAERVENFAHMDGHWRTNWLARLAVELRERPRGR
jgi:hypothetical protein